MRLGLDTFRRAAVRALLALAAMLGAAVPARADVISHGFASTGTRCTAVAEIDSTCVLPFGPPAAARTAITRIELGPVVQRDLYIGRPDPATAGEWIVRRAVIDPRAWRVLSGARTVDQKVETAIAIDAGEQLLVDDPYVATGGPTVDLELPAGAQAIGTRLVSGLAVAVAPLGSITTEPDADADGWGDTTGDLCPGVRGPVCAATTPKLTVSAPEYVPALDPVVAQWTVTNESTSPQPFVLNLASPTRVDQVQAPEGAVCTAGRTTNPAGSFVAPTMRSTLLAERLTGASDVSELQYRFDMWQADSTTCRLPVLAPRASVSGTFGGTGWTPGGYYSKAEAAAPFHGPGLAGFSASQFLVRHLDDAKPSRGFAPRGVKASGAASKPGRLVVLVNVLGANNQAPTVTGELRAPVGGKVLATLAAPVSVPSQQETPLTFTFSRSGLKWLAAHPRTTALRAVLTGNNARELPSTSSTKIVFKRSRAFKRQLAKLVPAKRSRGSR